MGISGRGVFFMGTVKLVFASDLAPIRKFAAVMKDEPAAVYGDLLTRFADADRRIVNLESPLCGGNDFIVKSGAAFTGEPEHVLSLTAAGFDTAVCANNHAFDRGEEGFFLTRDLLAGNNISCVGAGKDLEEARRPLTIREKGVKIGIFTISEGEDMLGAGENSPGVRPWEPEALAAQIRAAREDFDVILVSAHCGLEYQPFPSFYVYQSFRLWAEAGADMIIGHHPHVPQGRTFFGKTPAYFSLGNFVFYQPTDLLYRKIGYFLEIEADKSGIVAHRPVPYRIGDTGLRLLTGLESERFASLFKRLSAPLKDPSGALEAWHAVLAYNGVTGFERELEKILAALRATPEKGAAMLRNRVTCIQHFSQWIDGTSRIMTGTISRAPEELILTVKAFMEERTGK